MLSQDFVNVSLSHATMRPEDLIPAFANFLSEQKGIDPTLYPVVGPGYDFNSEDADWLLDSLFDKLNAIAPEGTYFGAHPGDGSDYGFWEFEDETEED